MTVTLTASYEQTLEADTIEQINALKEEQYDLQAMLEFIDEHSEKEFRFFYEDYVRLGEEVGYEAVDAFLQLHDVDDLDKFESAYVGSYISHTVFAEDFLQDEVDRLSYYIIVDWKETADYLLSHDFDEQDGHYFRTYF